MSDAGQLKCDRCGHMQHGDFVCREPRTEEICDDVGIFVPPSGLMRTAIVGVCQCGTYCGLEMWNDADHVHRCEFPDEHTDWESIDSGSHQCECGEVW